MTGVEACMWSECVATTLPFACARAGLSGGAVRAQVGSVFVAAVFLNWMASEHHHMHTPPPYGYLRVRTKPFPWGDKDLLDVRDTYVDDDDHH